MEIRCEKCGALIKWGDDPEVSGEACKACGHIQGQAMPPQSHELRETAERNRLDMNEGRGE